MELATIIHQYRGNLEQHYGDRLLPGHRYALDAMLRCRTPQSGQVHWACHHCNQHQYQPLSCGHRSCPRCQNLEATRWLDRQRAKLLPVDYFMATFTLPAQLRALAWRHQTVVYGLLFDCAVSTLRDFGLNPEKLGAELGMTAVLHTHARDKSFHPHVHIIVPGGGIHRLRRCWKKVKGRYLFNAFALAKVFRARMLDGLNNAGVPIPNPVPEQWVADCCRVGHGGPALEYLSRYLYRGVIAECDIIANQNGKVTFRYVESGTGDTRTRTLPGADFLWLILQHVLPRGFRRVRDYGFLHGNAKKLLGLVQLILHVTLAFPVASKRPKPACPECGNPMHAASIIRGHWHPG
ncbi:transposase [Halomonas sp. BM-2019]|uniref:IS91 family transposase n=1 Tax=Halomonas sp. BM-2019 TaxID=2811227 RepID=UPI001B3C403D|nr:MAG: transposase [Halomonas sp. BM-2019]